MTHEPECIWPNDGDAIPATACAMCILIRAAYRRGREDAAKDAAPIAELAYRDGYRDGREDAAEAVVRVPRWQYPDRADNRWLIDAEAAVAAAREQVVVSPATDNLRNLKPLYADTPYGRITLGGADAEE